VERIKTNSKDVSPGQSLDFKPPLTALFCNENPAEIGFLLDANKLFYKATNSYPTKFKTCLLI